MLFKKKPPFSSAFPGKTRSLISVFFTLTLGIDISQYLGNKQDYSGDYFGILVKSLELL